MAHRSQRESVLAQIAAEVRSIRSRPIVRVAIDGVDGAGKTSFGDELATRFEQPVIRASVDSFHNPRAVRYAKGKDSPEGFYEDSFNYEKLKEFLLDPLSMNPPAPYCCAYFDHRLDTEVEQNWKQPPASGVLIFDGIFVHRPELMNYWDYTIFLDVSQEESVRRCIDREGITGVSHDPRDPIHARYIDGQAMYLADCDPRRQCTRWIINERIEAPVLCT